MSNVRPLVSNESQISFRLSTREDAALFYQVIDKTMRGLIVATWGKWDEERVIRESNEECTSPNARVIQIAGHDAGVLLVEEEATHFQVQQVYLLPPFQRRGIGTEVLTRVVQRARAKEVPVRLRVLRVNPARLFYETLGFIVTEADNEFYQMERVA